MSLSAKLRRAPLRLVTGAFIVNSGLGKLKGDEATAAGIHGMAVGAYPVISKIQPPVFLKVLAISEIAVGTALLLPLVPAGLAGIALTGFAGSLLGMYVRTPALHDSKLRPTQAGTAVSKDIWMAGIGVGLIIDAALAESKITEKII